ncbi:conserved hypothetical membrane protein [Formosa agariphila KMM 3901]|uniref:Conserved hypothetical membrane protein n=1 Tax=Formosa agariphila (strain DSM 15362 / KCTC 12365 / LMG 23005 / KMM 3901 / M-2Alg 35-1) TaxID=1347342 RepID=T2KN97_FORAG|nr:hypothetical protein [Formosa agariphila]CDF79464.1 conserved hypothetical membrane protein [Formosa agariphila KMM 3901]
MKNKDKTPKTKTIQKTHKAVQVFSKLAIMGVLTIFSIMMVLEKYETQAVHSGIIILVITGIMWLGYKYLDLHQDDYTYEELLVVIWVPIGAIVCYALNMYANLGGVLSTAITGTAASFIPLLNKKSEYLKKLPPAIYCGSFVGMSSVEIAPSINFVIVAGILAGGFLLLSKNIFMGIGGKLGMVAFGGVLMVSFVYWCYVWLGL